MEEDNTYDEDYKKIIAKKDELDHDITKTKSDASLVIDCVKNGIENAVSIDLKAIVDEQIDKINSQKELISAQEELIGKLKNKSDEIKVQMKK